MKIRISLGSAIALGKIKAKINVKPTTLYLLTYQKNKCIANCLFCPQASNSNSDLEKLSRVSWPIIELEDIFANFKIEKYPFLKRICVQCINYKGVEEDAEKIINYIKNRVDLPISLSIKPLTEGNIIKLKEIGLDKICFPVDLATIEIFDNIKGRKVKGPYIYPKHIEALKKAVEIFGRFNVSTHLIIGLGETEEEAINFLIDMFNNGIQVGLFAFTPIKGTKLEKLKQPKIEKYRRIQLAHYLILNQALNRNDFDFYEDGTLKSIRIEKQKLRKIVNTGKPFLTSGCIGCNRPFYNEKISGPIYNYPELNIVKKDIRNIIQQLKGVI